MSINLAQVIRIFPNEDTQILLDKYIDYERYLYNKGLEEWNRMYSMYKVTKNKKDRPSRFKIQNYLRHSREQWELDFKYPNELNNGSSWKLNQAWQRFFNKDLKNKKPKFKTKKSHKRSVTFERKNDTTVRINNNYLKLTRTPQIRMQEPLRFGINTHITQCTITHQGKYWFASIRVRLPDDYFINHQITNGKYCGIDLGISSLMILHGEDGLYRKYKSMVPKLKPLYEKANYYSKQMSRRYNWNHDCDNQSNRYYKARTKYNNIWVKIKAIRKDYIEKVTSFIINRYQYICIEDLKVKNLSRNRCLSRQIFQTYWGLIKIRLLEKAKLYGNTIILADRFFPSTQLCSNCGGIRRGKYKLTLKDRVYHCQQCSLDIDRDFNAAINLMNYGKQHTP